jgi:hypothetical protein
MLSAEIEVYKLAEDAKKQATSGSFSNEVKEDRFAVATAFKSKTAASNGRPAAGKQAEETKVAQVLAAPATPPPPQNATFSEGVAENEKQPAKGTGKAPLAAKDESGKGNEQAGEVTKKPPPELVPKDEVSEQKQSSSVVTASNVVVPKDERNDDPSTWWIWVIVGVAAAGAVTAGGYFVATSGSSDEGNLRITW